jgi:hypothetical protein
VNLVATVRRGTCGGYSIQVSEAELSLIKAAIEQTERVSHLGMEFLDEAHRARDGRPLDGRRLRREIQTIAVREASLRSLRTDIAETERGEESA